MKKGDLKSIMLQLYNRALISPYTPYGNMYRLLKTEM